MDVVHKSWGTQVWNGNELIMIMRVGTKTSVHKHLEHHTTVECLSGECAVRFPYSSGYVAEDRYEKGRSGGIPVERFHQIVAVTDCVLRERYIEDGTLRAKPQRPIDDIVRLEESC